MIIPDGLSTSISRGRPLSTLNLLKLDGAGTLLLMQADGADVAITLKEVADLGYVDLVVREVLHIYGEAPHILAVLLVGVLPCRLVLGWR